MSIYKNKIFNDFLNIIIKTSITTLVIGYIVFNITYIRNDCPINENIFNVCEQIDLDESWQGRALYDQNIIFPEYMKWIYNALFFDFGVFSESDNGLSLPCVQSDLLKRISLALFTLCMGVYPAGSLISSVMVLFPLMYN